MTRRTAFLLSLGVLIGAMVVAVVGPVLLRGSGESDDSAPARLRAVADAVERFRRDHGRLPSALDDLRANAPGGAPYLHRAPLDPWGRAIEYRVLGPARDRFVLRSLGEDGVEDTEDDLFAPDAGR
jgi:general secretion pathway protein G